MTTQKKKIIEKPTKDQLISSRVELYNKYVLEIVGFVMLKAQGYLSFTMP